MTDEEAELIRCNRYFDILDTVINKIEKELSMNDTVLLTRDDWSIISEHIKGLTEITFNKGFEK